MILTLYYCNALLFGSIMLMASRHLTKELGSSVAAIAAIIVLSVLWPLVYISTIVYDLTVGFEIDDEQL